MSIKLEVARKMVESGIIKAQETGVKVSVVEARARGFGRD